MEVVAVSTARPTWVNINGSKIFTSIVHEPLIRPDEYIELDASGITNNSTAVHDGPVYAFFAEHYDYWCNELGVERASWSWCHWGENITFRCKFEKLTEHNLLLGDVWSVGEHVQLQVCGSRIPCFKLAWRCGQKDQWLKPLADSGYVGAYFRVLRGGRVHPGDEATLLRRSGENINMGLISGLGFTTSLKTRDTLDLLHNHELLLGLNRWLFGRRLFAIEDKESLGKNSWSGWRRFRIQQIRDEGGDIKSFYLSPVDGEVLANYQAGQFLTLRLPTEKMRSWSISDWPRDGKFNHYRVSIKRGADASRWMWDTATTDTVVEARSPAGSFVLDKSQNILPRQIYITAGIGITPILAMMKAHSVARNMDRTPGTWIHVSRDCRSTPFEEEWKSIEGPLLRRILFCTSPKDSDIQGVHYDYAGRPTRERMTKILGGMYSMNPFGLSDVEVDGFMSSVYVCGPRAFEEDVKSHLRALNIPEPLIRSEGFDTNGVPAGDLESSNVRFKKSGVDGKWERDKGQTLLELAESLGLAPAFGCRVGSCGSCAAKLVCGSVDGGLQLDGSVLICSAVPSTTEIEIEIEL